MHEHHRTIFPIACKLPFLTFSWLKSNRNISSETAAKCRQIKKMREEMAPPKKVYCHVLSNISPHRLRIARINLVGAVAHCVSKAHI